MRLWRISNYPDLSGLGGLRFAARWHSKGRPIIYTAEHPAGALSEFLAHVNREDMPDHFQMLTIETSGDSPPSAPRLPEGWIKDLNATRAIGDEWLAGRSSLLLRVPSALVPEAFNVLVNPLHADAGGLKVVGTAKVPLDSRFAR